MAQAGQIHETVPAEMYSEALELAYPIALESYRVSERRLDVVEKRLQELLTFAVTASLGIVAVCAGKVNLLTWQFMAATACFAAGVGTGIYARLSGHISLLSPEILYHRYLTKTKAEFQLDIVYWAGKANDANIAFIQKKSNLTGVAGLCFLVEAFFLAWWALHK